MTEDLVLTPSTQHPIRVTVQCTSELMDGLSATLFEAGAEGIEEGSNELVTYCCDPKLLRQLKSALELFETRVKSHRPGFHLKLHFEAVENTWDEIWQTALDPAQVSRSWTLRPIHSPDTEPGEQTLWFRPDVSFGAGGHDTTQLAATRIETLAYEGLTEEMLDVGTGTGVLAMVAKKCGVQHVLALDTDDVAIRSARANFELNELENVIQLEKGSANTVRRPYAWVVANINAHILLEIAKPLGSAVKNGGVLILTGLLETDTSEVKETFERLALKLRAKRSQNEWILLEFTKL